MRISNLKITEQRKSAFNEELDTIHGTVSVSTPFLLFFTRTKRNVPVYRYINVQWWHFEETGFYTPGFQVEELEAKLADEWFRKDSEEC